MALLLTLYIIAATASVTLNLFVAFFLLRINYKMTMREWIMLSMVVADLMQATFAYPTEIYGIYRDRLMRGIECTVCGFVLTGTSLVSFSHLTGLTVERAIILSAAMKVKWHKWVNDGWRSLYVIVPSWLYGLLWALPPLLGWNSYVQSTESRICSVDLTTKNDSTISYPYCLLVFCYFIPSTIMCVSCWKGRLGFATLGAVFFTEMPLHEPISREASALTDSTISHSVARRERFSRYQAACRWNKLQRKCTIECCAMVAAFWVMWTPYTCCMLVEVVVGKVPVFLMRISAFLGKLSTVADPIVILICLSGKLKVWWRSKSKLIRTRGGFLLPQVKPRRQERKLFYLWVFRYFRENVSSETSPTSFLRTVPLRSKTSKHQLHVLPEEVDQ